MTLTPQAAAGYSPIGASPGGAEMKAAYAVSQDMML